MSPAAPRDPAFDDDAVAQVARELRGGLTPLLHALAGDPPRPVRLTQGIRLDKSLASRLIQAIRAESDIGFLHQVPSPTGLRILLERARGRTDASLLRDVDAAVHRFEMLLDRLPGGRQALDARMGESSSAIREKREQIARQASFKAVSFLFGHYCETLTTGLFLRPSASAGRVDAIEIHRRIGLQRLTPGMALPLLSIAVGTPDDAGAQAPRLLPLAGEEASDDPADYLVAGASSLTVPTLDVVREGPTTTFALAPGDDVQPPTRLTTAYRVLRAEPLAPEAAYLVLRNYMLHTPCRTLIRDLYLAPGLWPDARPQIDFYLPGPSGTPLVSVEPGAPHLRRLNLTARIEQLPPGPRAFEAEEVSDQGPAIRLALERAGLDVEGWRGWRCRMGYPVPLVEMQLALRFTGR